MGWLKSLLGGKRLLEPEKSQSYTIRLGKAVPTDAVFEAWTSGDLGKMLGVTSADTNPIDRHFLLQSIVSLSYKQRAEVKYRKICIEHAEMHIAEFPVLAPALKADLDGVLPRVTTFQHYATVLTENGEFNNAIYVCETALKWGLKDGTQSGFQGRIARIRKQAAKGA